jgi:glycosyltransferase involved in cell wall biosynthesis
VEAFTRSGRPLVVIGDGATRALRASAGRNVRFLGAVDDATLAEALARCRALIFPGVEDFGIIPLEAMASGRPVIAYRRGGATETVVEGRTGLFFNEQTPEALMAAVERFEARTASFDPAAIRAHAARFDRPVFLRSMRAFVDRCLGERNAPLRAFGT